jgi:rod shape determining protein RodA
MYRRKRLATTGIDYPLLLTMIALIAIGWTLVYSVGYKNGYHMDPKDFLFKTPVGKQTLFLSISVLFFFIIMAIDGKIWNVLSYPIYALGLIALFLVLFLGAKINGARAWFLVGGFSFQPVELAKIGTALALSSVMAGHNFSFKDKRAISYLIFVIFAPVALLILQPDDGSSLVFMSLFIALFREGFFINFYIVVLSLLATLVLALMFNPNLLALGFIVLGSTIFISYIQKHKILYIIAFVLLEITSFWIYNNGKVLEAILISLIFFFLLLIVHSVRARFRLAIVISVSLLVVSSLIFATDIIKNNLKPHQQVRIDMWLNLEKCDPRGPAYNIINSKMAIGSGGMLGKGFLQGAMTKLNYIPEQSSDFIFCTVGEERGFVGVFIVIVLYVFMMLRIIIIAERQRNRFTRHYAYCVVGIIMTHFFINIGMTMGLIPVIGIPLPFISSGGTSLMSFIVMITILLKLDSFKFE